MTRWVETFKGAVLASEYDAAAYMNSAIYVSRFDQATWFLLHSIGVTPDGMKRKKLRVAIVTRRAAIVSGGIGVLSVLAVAFLDNQLTSEPTQPNIESGRVVPWNEKGITHYVTTGENVAFRVAFTLGFASAILPIYVFI